MAIPAARVSRRWISEGTYEKQEDKRHVQELKELVGHTAH